MKPHTTSSSITSMRKQTSRQLVEDNSYQKIKYRCMKKQEKKNMYCWFWGGKGTKKWACRNVFALVVWPMQRLVRCGCIVLVSKFSAGSSRNAPPPEWPYSNEWARCAFHAVLRWKSWPQHGHCVPWMFCALQKQGKLFAVTLWIKSQPASS